MGYAEAFQGVAGLGICLLNFGHQAKVAILVLRIGVVALYVIPTRVSAGFSLFCADK